VSAILPGTPLSQQDAERLIQQYVDHYNNVLLPLPMPAGRQKETQAARSQAGKSAPEKATAPPPGNGVLRNLSCLVLHLVGQKKQPVPEWTPKRAAKSGN
jgi:hypothetical protein